MASSSKGIKKASIERRFLTGSDMNEGMMKGIYGDHSAFESHKDGTHNVCPFKAKFVRLWNTYFPSDDASPEPRQGGFFDTVTHRLFPERMLDVQGDFDISELES